MRLFDLFEAEEPQPVIGEMVYLGGLKTVYNEAMIGDIRLIVALDLKTGLVLFSAIKSDARIEALLRNKILLQRPLNINTALKNIDVCIEMFAPMLKKWHIRTNNIIFTASTPTANVILRRYFRSGLLKQTLMRYRYSPVDTFPIEQDGYNVYHFEKP